MDHPDTIFVTSLFDMPHYVAELAPTRLVSVIQPELMPTRPEEIAEAAHLRVGVHDITERRADGGILAAYRHMEQIVEFVNSWNPTEGALLVHCYAGISRSTATALIAACVKSGNAAWSAQALRAASPHAIPNRHFVALADEVLGQRGKLIEARESMGEPLQRVVEGPLTVLRIATSRPAS